MSIQENRVLKPIDMTALLTRMSDHLEALYPRWPTTWRRFTHSGGGLDATGRELLKDVNAALERA